MKLLVCVASGYVIAVIFGIRHLEDAQWYHWVTAGLLTIGLYSSAYGIVLQEARQHIKIILSAVTIGVFLKALFIGCVLSLLLGDPFYLILGIMMAQIDPLSVSTLMHGSRLSAKAKTILASWAAFDDPITVIMALYLPILVGKIVGEDWLSVTNQTQDASNLFGYVNEVGLNLVYAIVILILWLFTKRYVKRTYALLGIALSFATYHFWMLSVALIGLFLRPPIEPIIERTVKWVLRLSVFLLGILLVGGMDIIGGLWLGTAAFVSQILVGFLLTFGLNKKDRLHIAFAQQNGITAIILALLFQPIYPKTIGVIAPAIVVVYLIHGITNKFIDKYVLK